MMYPTVFKRIFLFLFFSTLMLQSGWAKVDHLRCMWRSDPATTMVVGWNQLAGNNPVLYYDMHNHGSNPSDYFHKQTPDRISKFKGMNNHFVRLKDLVPNTVYYFMIVDSEGSSRQFSFKTMPDNQDAKLSIIAGGDSRNNRDARKSANLIVGKMRPHFVMFGGDMTGKDVDHEWLAWMDDWQATISKNGRITPIIVARGNHEYSNKTLIELFDVAHVDLYYKMSFADDLLQVYTLNSLMATGGDQKNWLQQSLASNQQAIWKFGQYHYTIRPHTKRKAERNDQYENWAKLFFKYEVDLVVESDAHVVKSTYPLRPTTESGSEEGFIRDDENGTVYVGEGCWGAPLRTNDDTKSWTRDSGSFNQFKWIMLDKSGIEIRTIKTDNGASVGEVVGDHVYTAPANLNIWKASNGDVIYIKNKESQGTLVSQPVSRPNTNTGQQPNHSPITSKPTSTASSSTSVIEDNEIVAEEIIAEEIVAEKEVLAARGKMKITDFKAAITSTNISVSWTTSNEPNGLNFEIQRSLDGKTYETIETVIGEPLKNAPTSYLINDRIDRENLQNGLSYRLRRTLPNGNVKVFAPCMVGADLKQWNTYSQISPDDDGQLKVKYALENSANVSVRLLSIKKREIRNSIYKNQTVGNYLKTIDMKGLPRGSYIVVIKAGRQIIRRYRVVKL